VALAVTQYSITLSSNSSRPIPLTLLSRADKVIE
jgi:hypothetical protein